MVDSQTILDYFRDKKILLTGHTGFKGSWMLEILARSGAEVYGLALEPQREEDLYVQLDGDQRVKHSYIQDIRDASKVREIIREISPDFIFHLAAQPLVLRSYLEPVYTYEVNLMGTIHILDALRDYERRCTSILITTDKVYENREENYAYKEDDKFGGYDPYSASKATCEIAISSYVRSFFDTKRKEKHQQQIASARAGNVIGGGDMSENRLVPDLYRYVKNGGALDIRRPDAVRPWQHVIEPAWAYIYMAYLIDTESAEIDSLNIGPLSADNLSVAQVVEMFLEGVEHSGNVRLGEVKGLPHEAGLLMLDIQKAKEAINWEPLLSAKEAIAWTADWYFSEDTAQKKTEEQISKYLNIWDNKYNKNANTRN